MINAARQPDSEGQSARLSNVYGRHFPRRLSTSSNQLKCSVKVTGLATRLLHIAVDHVCTLETESRCLFHRPLLAIQLLRHSFSWPRQLVENRYIILYKDQWVLERQNIGVLN
jgi:hypothetical protein